MLFNEEDLKKYFDQKADKSDMAVFLEQMESKVNKKILNITMFVIAVLVLMVLSIVCSMWVDSKNSKLSNDENLTRLINSNDKLLEKIDEAINKASLLDIPKK